MWLYHSVIVLSISQALILGILLWGVWGYIRLRRQLVIVTSRLIPGLRIAMNCDDLIDRLLEEETSASSANTGGDMSLSHERSVSTAAISSVLMYKGTGKGSPHWL